MSNQAPLVSKIWDYCSILRDDGLSYGDYVEQLTFLQLRAANAAWGHAAYNTSRSVPVGRLPSTGVE